jgi:transposase
MHADLSIKRLLARLETLEAEVAALRRENQQLRQENQQLRRDNQQLCQANEQLRRESRQLRQENQQLRDEIARLKKNSSNSSKPPSSDIVAPPKDPTRRGKKNKIGGQPGHPRHQRPPFDAKQIDQICLHELSPEEVRRRKLRPLDSWHVLQQVEWVDKPYVVTEHRARRYVTPAGRIVLAPLPPEIRGSGLLGPNLTALVGWLKARGHVSYGGIAEFFRDVLALPISGGHLSGCCTGKLSEALKPAYEEAASALRQESVLGSDETGHYHGGQGYWTWCLRAAGFTVFRIDATRATQVLVDLLGEDFGGILTVDYYSANRSFARRYEVRAQYCWSHLLRDVKFLRELGRPPLVRWANQLLAIARGLFRAWHRRTGADPPRWRRQMERWKGAFLEKIRRPPDEADALKLRRRFDRHGAPAYFRFLDEPGVEPTNNATERAIRQPVLDRRITQGTRSVRGLRWCERAWTTAATCSQQGRSTFRFFRDALVAYFTNAPAPSLLSVNP